MGFYVTKISDNKKTRITTDYSTYDSLVITNSHATDAITVDLYATSQLSTDITTTGVYAAETEAVSTSSVALTVDDGTGSASDGTSDMFLNEQVWKSDGTLFGTCTTFNSTILLTFSGGLSNAITNNDILFTGTRYYILNNVVIPNGASLKLERDEINFNNISYYLYIKSDTAAGGLDVFLRRNT